MGDVIALPDQRRSHECSMCGKVEPWNEEVWAWFGSYMDLDDGKPIIKVCSEECRETAKHHRIMENPK